MEWRARRAPLNKVCYRSENDLATLLIGTCVGLASRRINASSLATVDADVSRTARVDRFRLLWRRYGFQGTSSPSLAGQSPRSSFTAMRLFVLPARLGG